MLIDKNKEYIDISDKAKNVWTISSMLINASLFLFVYLIILISDINKKIPNDSFIRYGTISMFVIVMVIDIFIMPYFKQKNWKYFVCEEYIEIQTGRFLKKKIIVPTKKICSITKRSGPILKMYHLEKINFGTIADSYDIPCLTKEAALDLQKKILLYS